MEKKIYLQPNTQINDIKGLRMMGLPDPSAHAHGGDTGNSAPKPHQTAVF